MAEVEVFLSSLIGVTFQVLEFLLEYPTSSHLPLMAKEKGEHGGDSGQFYICPLVVKDCSVCTLVGFLVHSRYSIIVLSHLFLSLPLTHCGVMSSEIQSDGC